MYQQIFVQENLYQQTCVHSLDEALKLCMQSRADDGASLYCHSHQILAFEIFLQEDLYQQACVHSLEEALERCARIGYPIMLKASWGGGGKGIRKASRLAALTSLASATDAW